MKKILASVLMIGLALGVHAQQPKPKQNAAKPKATNNKQTPSKPKQAQKMELNKEYTTASGLKYKITQKGNGAKASAGFARNLRRSMFANIQWESASRVIWLLLNILVSLSRSTLRKNAKAVSQMSARLMNI